VAHGGGGGVGEPTVRTGREGRDDLAYERGSDWFS
jgi:hypothetical protein